MKGNKKSSSFFTAKRPRLGGTRIDGSGRIADNFSNIQLRMDENLLLVVIRDPHARARNDKITFPVITSSIGHKFRTHFEWIRNRRLCGQFGTKRLPSMSGGPASPRSQFLSNVFFVFRIRANP